MHIDIVGDIVCPWCLIGKRRLDRALARRPEGEVSLSWRPFQINPHLPAAGMDRAAYLQSKFGNDLQSRLLFAAIAEAGARDGITFAFDRVQRMPNSLDAHRLIAWSAERGDDPEPLIEALFHAFFVEGADLGDRSSLARIAHAHGIPEQEAAAYLAGGAGTKDVLRDDRAARRLGIAGVPCFIIDGTWTIAGALEPEFFLPLFDLAANARH